MALFGDWLTQLLSGQGPQPAMAGAGTGAPVPPMQPPVQQPAPQQAPAQAPDALSALSSFQQKQAQDPAWWQKAIGIFGGAARDYSMARAGHPEMANGISDYMGGIRGRQSAQLAQNAMNETVGQFSKIDPTKPIPLDLQLRLAQMQMAGLPVGPLQDIAKTEGERADKMVHPLTPDQIKTMGLLPGTSAQQDIFGKTDIIQKPDYESPQAFAQKQALEKLSQGPAWANVAIAKQRLAMDQQTASGLASGDSPTIDYVAQQYMQTGTLPPLGMGKQAAAMRQAIIARAAQLSQQQGISGTDAVAIHAGTKANTAALSKQTQLRSATEGFENTMLQNMNVVRSLLKKGAGTTGVPVINRFQQYVRGEYQGDPDVIALNNAIDTVADENAKIRSGTLGNTPATDSMRSQIKSGLHGAMTPQQIESAFQVMEQDAGNRTRALRAQEDALKSGLHGGSDAPSIPGIRGDAPAAQSGPKVGTVQQGYRFNGGNPSDPHSWSKVQ